MSRHVDQSGAFEIASMPGQPNLACCHSFFVIEQQRGHGKGKALKEAQRRTLRALHYDFAINTVSAKNIAMKRVLEAAGWVKLSEFYNKRLSETTEIWGVEL
jgi:GNAT superfamily N-acetyltransferase